MIEFVVPGRAVGKGRPKVNTVTRRAFTPRATRIAERAVRSAWEAAGRPRVPDGAVHLGIVVRVRRPRAHVLRGGGLSAEGRRRPVPTSRPDFDNVAKTVSDALTACAYRDDALVASHVFRREWGERDELVVTLAPHPAEAVCS